MQQRRPFTWQQPLARQQRPVAPQQPVAQQQRAGYQSQAAATTTRRSYAHLSPTQAKLMNGVEDAIGNVRTALTRVNGSWDARTHHAMQALFGRDASSPHARQLIGRKLMHTLAGLEYTKAIGGRNLSIYPFAGDRPDGRGNGPIAGVKHDHTGIDFSTNYLARSRPDTIANLVAHEHSHLFGGTVDNWYLNPDFSRRNNFGGRTETLTLANAANNADTIAKAADVLMGRR